MDEVAVKCKVNGELVHARRLFERLFLQEMNCVKMRFGLENKIEIMCNKCSAFMQMDPYNLILDIIQKMAFEFRIDYRNQTGLI